MTEYEISVDLQQLLVEVGVEEMPSHEVRTMATAFGDLIAEELAALRIDVRHLRAMATPRRLVVMAQAGRAQAPLREQIRGPLLANAYRDGAPTGALLGFCRRLGISPSELATMGEGERTYVCAFEEKAVDSLRNLLPAAVERAFGRIPLSRSMRWGLGDYRFIRPVRWCTLWVDDELLPLHIAGVSARAETFGNRTDHPGAMRISSIASYEQALSKGFVVLDVKRREQVIVSDAQELADSVGGSAALDEDLLEEVVQLVEWPTVFLGKFDPAFLAVPSVVLVTSMKVHQRYFPVVDEHGALLPYFIGVRNGIGSDMELVVRGNEKVLKARLSDALYFYEADRRKRLDDDREKLSGVVFHAKLGTYGDKMAQLHRIFAATKALWLLTESQKKNFSRAVDLYKADLLSQVVQEFPELQGVMGGIYAAAEGEDPEVSGAIGEQYHPGAQGDRIPRGAVAQLLVLLDRLDTVMRGIDQGLKPTGSEDPFGIRRSALAIGRILKETDLWTDSVFRLFATVGDILGVKESAVQESYDLVAARLSRYLESEGSIPAQDSQAVLGAGGPWREFDRWLDVLRMAREDPRWEMVAQAYKRADRVLGTTPVAGELPSTSFPLRVEEEVRRAVAAANQASTPAAWLESLKALSASINTLFEEVLVNDPDPSVRSARLQLLAHARASYHRYFAMNLA